MQSLYPTIDYIIILFRFTSHRMIEPNKIIGKFICLLDGLETREDFYSLQYSLLDTLYEVEKAISISKDKPESIPYILGMGPATDEEKKKLAFTYLDNAEFAKEILLSFGDSLAWILLSREFIRGSVDESKGGNITFRSGFESEVETLKLMEKKKDTYAVLCDLTHCLGISDVITIGPDGMNMIEVKYSSYPNSDYDLSKDNRFEKQRRKMSWLRKYSSVKEGELPFMEGQSEKFEKKYGINLHSKRIITNIEDRHYFKELEDVILRAKQEKNGFAYTTLDGVGLLEAYYYKENEMWISNALDSIGICKKDDALILSCLNKHITEFSDIIPIPLFDISQTTRYDLLTQNVTVFVTYPVKYLIQLFSKEGVDANWDESLTLSKKQNGHSVVVQPYQINRLLYELLTPDSFVKMLSTAIDILD